jgi:hypothetical protein
MEEVETLNPTAPVRDADRFPARPKSFTARPRQAEHDPERSAAADALLSSRGRSGLGSATITLTKENGYETAVSSVSHRG